MDLVSYLSIVPYLLILYLLFQNPECKVFIGGLNKRTVVKTLQEHFEQWGELVDSVVIKDKDTKLSRG